MEELQLGGTTDMEVEECNLRLQLSVSVVPQINFACHQNAVPVIREIEIVNPTERVLHDLTLEMHSSPAFITTKHWHIDRLLADGTLHINDRDTRLDGEYLLNLLEQQCGELTFRLKANDGQILAESIHPLELLARNEWGGYGSSPELLAAFCMPNERSIDKVLRSASDLLRASGEEATLKNYESGDPKRIWMQASAVWNALLAQRIDYAYPPSSFERTGQKVRTPDAILESKRATCLDTTLLLAALFEQMRLNPVIVVEEGHAYVGLWLRNEGFARPYVEDLLALRKRVCLRELIVIETTLLCQGAPFKTALKHAEDQLQDENTRFIGVVDITRAREEQIKPLSYVRQYARSPHDVLPSGESGVDAEVAPIAIDYPDDPASLGGDPIEWSHVANGTAGRLAQWQRKLLDLTLRNPLLSMRTSKTNIPLIAPNPALLEDLLADGKALTIESVPLQEGRDRQLYTQQTGEKLDEQTALTALTRGKIYAPIEQQKLESSLIELYRKARSDLEEGGSNTLFLAIGVLYWQRPDSKEKTYRAPLILLPVTITRQSVRSGIRLTLSDDEVRFNTTLLEMLRQDFALDIQGLDGQLPMDQSGTDINAILTHIRHEVKEVAGFEVRDEVALSTFSFAKYLMWKDLVDRTDQLKDNPVVAHLIDTPREPFKQASEFIEPSALDKKLSPAELFTPLNYDSSQLAAVVASSDGKNFVMIGPPGTGKSQTIANIIAHNLGLGRTILFVSEKAAALDVVYRRLREQGLGEFCLELHSNKAKKLDVLRQLGEAWDTRGQLSSAEWDKQTQRLRLVRDELNQFVQSLHEQHRNGMSISQGLGDAVSGQDVVEISLSWPSPDQHDSTAYEQLLALGERIEVNAAEIGNLVDHPLGLLHTSDWSMGWQQAVLQQAGELSLKTLAWREQIRTVAERLQLEGEYIHLDQLRPLSKLLLAVQGAANKDLSFAFAPNAKEIADAVLRVERLLQQFAAAQAQLSCTYDRASLLQCDLSLPQQLWTKAKGSWWLPRTVNEFKCRNLLKQQAGASTKPDPEHDLPLLLQLQSLKSEIDALQPLLEKVAGWRGLDSDTAVMTDVCAAATVLRNAIAGMAQDADQLLALRASVRKFVVDGNDLLAADGALGLLIARYQDAEQAFNLSLNSFAELAARQPDEILTMPAGLDGLLEACKSLGAAQNKLNAWCAWRRARAEAVDRGLHPIIDAIEKGYLAADAVRRAIKVNYARWWVAQKIDASPVIRNFVSVEHERKIVNFKQLDQSVRKITAEHIKARIRQGLAQKDEVKKTSEFGIIKRELEKKARHKPLRQLITETSSAISSLTPCLLMSPLSVAQYLPVNQKPFDLVIFDEASQIAVWDAIGAIARAKQTIMVGDPKQLPPTSFFMSAQNDEDQPEIEQDLESILDEMLGANMPTINLSWHYRSRNESLITFSNHRYYNGGLITFPAPETQDRAVNMTFVGGVYDRGASQTNRAEADAIVAEIERRLTDPELSKQTIGVVTFNQKQQTLILDLLDAARRANPELDKFFAEDLIEPVFVKNLEAVQGDERDVILFSITFGPDNTGRIAMNFGPLNQNGGERRLNVAITRARSELKVFSSIRPEQIDLSRTGAVGVRDLKHFLEFAERGPRALGEAVFGSVGDFDSPFESAVARALQAKGWTVHPQIGVSQFRIDLGIVDPHAAGRYLAGIECDGATYHRSATARDRDMVREGVLRGLGWEILRLWSTDFWIDPQGCIDKLDQQLRALLAASEAARQAAIEAAEQAAAELAAQAATEAAELVATEAATPAASDTAHSGPASA